MAYIIIVGDDNSLYGSCKERILQKEKMFNKLCFLVAPHYKGYDMSQCTVTMRYLLPISKEFVIEELVLSDEKHEDHLMYVLPIDTKFTKEWGEVQLNLTFTMLDVDDDGNVIQRVRKTDNYNLKITELPDWDKFIPDPALENLDQRILKIDAQMKALAELSGSIDGNVNLVDNLVYDDVESTLQLSSKGVGVGDKVSVKDMLDEGSPVVNIGSKPNTNDELAKYSIVEF